ncbi:Aste57867_17738 [Aphanomyces stellatus]|uniref:Aste57867_17738 protein n=1 Tax=Aphanomyces stellatus TaxID=120398 RepID=A0A485LA55_9STRA|nr:hypothetical protein As57867_017677 [Aphanomyces stellatus]VFT94484.1 Aste57867_17738 [Aphanomyces stellatus]
MNGCCSCWKSIGSMANKCLRCMCAMPSPRCVATPVEFCTMDDCPRVQRHVVPADGGPESEADPWCFLGSLTLYDWANGQREVYTFEGDDGSVTLMSRQHALKPLAADMPGNASAYLWLVCIYVSVVSF